MKNFSKEKDVGLVGNRILEERHLSTENLYLNSKGNSLFTKSILYFIES